MNGVQMGLYDAHCHLQDERIAPGALSEILEGYRSIGLQRAVVNGTCPDDWDAVAALADRDARILPSFGLHPWRVAAAGADWKRRLRGFLERYPESGVGEIGLDRWIEGFDIEAQLDAFRWQLDLAAELNRPVSIHCLRAWGLMLETLQSNALPKRGFLLHSYGGSEELVPRFAELGAFFSLSSYFAIERKSAQRRAFRSAPLDRLLIETDAPDMLGPERFRCAELRDAGGAELNHPLNLVGVYRFASELLELDRDAVEALAAANWRRLFEG